MHRQALTVLTIEDNEDDAELILHELRRAGYQPRGTRVETAEALQAALDRQAWDLVTCDYHMPRLTLPEAITMVRAHDERVPVIVVSAQVSPELSTAAVRSGADDLVFKDRLPELTGAVDRVLRRAATRQRRASAEVERRREREDAAVATALARLGREMLAPARPPEVLHRLCRVAADLLHCDGSHLVLRTAQGDYALVADSDELSEPWEEGHQRAIRAETLAPVMAQLEQETCLLVEADALAEDDCWEALIAPHPWQWAVCVALRNAAGVAGCLFAGSAQRRQPFGAIERRIGDGISDFGSLALANAHLFDTLAESNRAKSEFVAMVSHELRTPLHHIIGFTDLVLDDAEQLSREHTDALDIVRRSSHDLLELINGVLAAARLESGPAALDGHDVDVGALVRELATDLPPGFAPAPLDVIWDVPADLPRLTTDAIKLKVVLRNLLENARKFTERGRIAFSAAARADGVEFTVSDTGIGIAPEVLPVIFEPFRQADSSSTRRHGGIGLGLYIVHRMLELLGGTVSVESAVGRGSTFRVWIPSRGAERARPAFVTDPAADLYAELLDQTSDLVFTVAPNGRLLYANRAWRAALGYDSDDLQQLTLIDTLTPQSAAQFRMVRDGSTGEESAPLELVFQSKRGQRVHAAGRIRWQDEGGERSAHGIFRDLTERERAEAALRASNEWLDLAARASQMGFWRWDLQSGERRLSPGWWSLLGYRPDEVDSSFEFFYSVLLHPDDRAPLLQRTQEHIERGATRWETELRLRHKDGSYRWILDRGTIQRAADGRPLRHFGSHTDITERKQMELALAESERRFRTLIEHAADPVIVHDEAGRITDVNRAACESLGYTGEELLGLPLSDIDERFADTDMPTYLAQMAAAEAVRVETRYRRKDGSAFAAEVHTAPFTFAGRLHALATVRDITERQRAQAMLRNSEAYHRVLFEHAPDPVFAMDLSGRLLDGNRAAELILGYPRQELIGKDVVALHAAGLLPEDELVKVAGLLPQYAQGLRTGPDEITMCHRDGHLVPLEIRAYRAQFGQTPGLLGIARDVTERLRMEQALRDSETRYREVLETVDDAIFTYDLDGNFTMVTAAMTQLTGYSEGELLTMNIAHLVAPQHFRLSDDQPPGEFVMDVVRKDGSQLTADVRARPMFRGGEAVGWVGMARNISDRLRLESALHQAEERLARAIAGSGTGLCELDVASQHLQISPDWKTHLGYPADQASEPYQVWAERLHPDDRKAMLATVRAALSDPSAGYEDEFRMRHRDGSYRWVLARGRVLVDAGGQPWRLAGTFVDISERKASESALQTANERLERVFSATHTGAWEAELDSEACVFSPQWKALLGYADDEMANQAREWRDRLHPDDRERVLQLATRCLQPPWPEAEIDYRLRHRDGSYRWVHSRARVALDADGRPIRFVGTMVDISERKNAERALQRAEERLARALAASDTGLWEWTPGGDLYIVPIWKAHFGYRADERPMAFDDWVALLHPGDRQRVLDELQAAVLSRGEVAHEYRVRHRDGSYRWVFARGRMLASADGDSPSMLGSSVDITERKHMEEALRQANRELEEYGHTISHDLRAPLRAIDAFSRALLEDFGALLAPEARNYLERIQRNGMRMEQLIQDLFALSRVSRHELQRVPVDLTRLASEVVAGLREAQPRDGVEVVIADGLHAQADASLLRAVLENLLGNAWKYTGKRAQARIELGCIERDELTAFFVRDNGAGFNPAHTDKLFTPFRRLHKSSEFEGTGIGLAIVGRIISRHGGEVWAEGAEQRGATFYFTLPAP